MKTLLLILKAAVVVGLLVLVAVGASAALDAPSRTSTTSTVIEAPRETVWRIVTDFASYPEWNPYMTTVRGTAQVGETLHIRLVTPRHDPRDIEATVFVLKPPRKLRWQSRMFAPGVRDLEYEIIVAPLGPNRAQVVQRARYEGLLAVLVDHEATAAGLERMAAALERRAEAGA